MKEKTQVVSHEFLLERKMEAEHHQNIEVFYVLDGELMLTVEDQEFVMKAEDVIVLNANRKHSYTADQDVLIASFLIDFAQMSKLLGTSQLLFWCNSTIDRSWAYDELKVIMKRIFAQSIEEDGQGVIYLTSLYYQFLHVLVTNFMVKTDDERFQDEKDIDEERMVAIYNYINSNYNQPISLSDLSEKLFLSVPYLSKYIKKKFGQNFVDYVNGIRLFHGIEDLLYTDKTIMYIAMENGFANTASFNATFQKAYGVSPSQYRKQMKPQKQQEREQDEQAKQQIVQAKLAQILEEESTERGEGIEQEGQALIVRTNEAEQSNQPWGKMINIGTASDLLRFDIQEHVLMLKENLGFRYIRFWNIYDEAFYLNENSKAGNYNFEKLDRVFDFLIEAGLCPYIELGDKPQQLYRTVHQPIVLKEKPQKFEDQISFERFLKGFASHIANRYGVEEIEKWYFELWNNEAYAIESGEAVFFKEFEIMYKSFKSISHNIKVGGPGIGIQFGRQNVENLLKYWEHKLYRPDFISLYSYPYLKGYGSEKPYARISTDRDFLKNQLIMARELIKESNLRDVEIHVSEWNSTVSNRNSLNDSCYKAAYVLKSITDTVDSIDILGYWLGSDIFAEHLDSKILLNGACGLISKDGIKKPAFYAYDFMNHIGNKVLGRDANSIITDKGHNRYCIACHNYRHLNYKYYLKAEDEILINKQGQFFEDTKEVRLDYQINGIANGMYQVITYSVNREHGSVQDEWGKMEYNEYLSKNEIEYLKRICTPHIFMKTCEVKDGKLNLETKLKAQEIQCLDIKYLYT